MLVLTRKQNEVIRIGRDVEVTVVRIHGRRVQLGIRAPREVAIVRGDVDNRKRKAG